MRYWQVERFMWDFWIGTDYRVAGETPEQALAAAEGTKPAGWEAVRLGREVQADEHYCDFAWAKAS